MPAEQPRLLTVTTVPVQLVFKGHGPATIRNRDAKASVYLGYEEGFDPAGNTCVVVDPLSSHSVDGKRDVWASARAPDAPSVNVVPGGLSATTAPVPVTETYANLVLVFNQNIAPGATFTVPSATGLHAQVAQYPGLVGVMFAQSTAAQGVAPYFRFRLEWSNANDNFDPQITEDWVCASGPFSFTSNYRHNMTFNVFGDSLQMFVTNYDTTAISWTIGLFGSYRSRTTDIRGRYPDSLANESQGLNTDDIIYANTLPQVAIGGSSAPQLLPLAPGDAELTVLLAGEAAAGQTLVRIQPQPSQVGAIAGTAVLGQKVYRSSSAGYILQQSAKLPRRVCTLTVDNTSGTAAVTPTILLTGSSDIH